LDNIAEQTKQLGKPQHQMVASGELLTCA